MSNPDLALEKFKAMADGHVLNVGDTQDSKHTKFLESKLKVSTVNLHGDCTYKKDFHGEYFGQFDGVWAAHVLEHSPNPNLFLKTVYKNCKYGGLVCITVPPLKHQIVGGHVTLWNAGLLMYNMIIAGFDCSDAILRTYGYNISLVVKKKKADLPELSYDNGDIEKLEKFFPIPVEQNFNGQIENINWR